MVTELCEGGDLEQYLKVRVLLDWNPQRTMRLQVGRQLTSCRASLVLRPRDILSR